MEERDEMASVYAECKRLGLEDDRLTEIEHAMGCDETALLKLQYVIDWKRKKKKKEKIKDVSHCFLYSRITS